MKILVIGSGAREHALVHSLAKDEGTEIFCAPGNAGIALEVSTFPLVATDSVQAVSLAAQLEANLVVIGAEAPLVAGVGDALRAAGFAVFGPSGAAAQLEGSKAFAKDVMIAAGVPTALSYTCQTEVQVRDALTKFGAPYVVKDDGLAAGKGVVVTNNFEEAITHAMLCISGRTDGAVVIEEYLAGPEVSLFGVTDGKTVRALSPAQDFKRALDNDEGPNTGGMGAYSPLDWAPENLVAETIERVLQPTIDEMAKRGTPFSGLLYAGLALTANGIKVIEFNARFGDPETQVVLSRLKSPLSQLLFAAANGTLTDLPELQWSDEAAITVVLAAQGYPQDPVAGAVISGLEQAQASGSFVYHAGTKATDAGEIVVSGGRVLCVTGTGANLADAREKVYAGVTEIEFAGSHHRTDIALQASRGEIEVP